ncbi:MAG TPA: hypothetical protein VF226_04855 [Hyphomicrobiaceae bacterium]
MAIMTPGVKGSSPIALVEERYEIGKEHRRPYEEQWRMNLAFYVGKQWHIVHPATGKLIEPPSPPWRVRMVANYLLSFVWALFAKLTKNRPVMVAKPATGEEDDINAARRASKLLDYLWRHLELDDVRNLALLWMLTCGKAFMKTYWDGQAGPQIDEFIGDRAITFFVGEVAVEAASPFEVVVDPAADSTGTLKGAEWMIHEKIRTVESIEEQYGVRVPPEDVSKADFADFVASGFTRGFDVEDRTSSSKKLDHHAIVKEYWERPSPRFPNGRMIAVASGKLLVDGPFPMTQRRNSDPNVPFHPDRRFPFVELQHIIVPGQFWPMSLVEGCISLQRQINRVISKLQEQALILSSGKILSPWGAIDEKRITDEPGQVVSYRGAVPPTFWTPPPLPQSLFNLISVYLETMRDIMGVRETSLGAPPPGVRSGVALSLLLEQDETKLGPVVANVEKAFSGIGSRILCLAQQNYLEPRTVEIAGRNGIAETIDFYAADIRSTDVEVQAGSALPKLKSAQQQFIVSLAESGFIDIRDPEERRRALKLMDAGIFEPEVDEETLDEQRAELENKRMAAGIGQLPNHWENHQVHIREHNRFRKTDDFERLDPLTKQLFEIHVRQHEMLAMQLAQQDLQRAAVIQGAVQQPGAVSLPPEAQAGGVPAVSPAPPGLGGGSSPPVGPPGGPPPA